MNILLLNLCFDHEASSWLQAWLPTVCGDPSFLWSSPGRNFCCFSTVSWYLHFFLAQQLQVVVITGISVNSGRNWLLFSLLHRPWSEVFLMLSSWLGLLDHSRSTGETNYLRSKKRPRQFVGTDVARSRVCAHPTFLTKSMKVLLYKIWLILNSQDSLSLSLCERARVSYEPRLSGWLMVECSLQTQKTNELSNLIEGQIGKKGFWKGLLSLGSSRGTIKLINVSLR